MRKSLFFCRLSFFYGWPILSCFFPILFFSSEFSLSLSRFHRSALYWSVEHLCCVHLLTQLPSLFLTCREIFSLHSSFLSVFVPLGHVYLFSAKRERENTAISPNALLSGSTGPQPSWWGLGIDILPYNAKGGCYLEWSLSVYMRS